jgi:hypothetical protein
LDATLLVGVNFTWAADEPHSKTAGPAAAGEAAAGKAARARSEMWTLARRVGATPSTRWAHDWVVADIEGTVLSRAAAPQNRHGDGGEAAAAGGGGFLVDAAAVEANAVTFLLAPGPGHPALFATKEEAPLASARAESA